MPWTIPTRRLCLRPLSTEDLDAIHAHWTDPDVRRYLWDDAVISPDRAAAVIVESLRSFESYGFGSWAITLKDETAVIGFCGLRVFGKDGEIEILYSLSPEIWGRGLATEAARAVLRYGFTILGLERIYAGADPPNRASIRVMEKLGMQFAKRLVLAGQEAVYYSVSREQFPGVEDVAEAP